MREKCTLLGIVLALACAGAAPLQAGSNGSDRNPGDRAAARQQVQSVRFVREVSLVSASSSERILRARVWMMRLARTMGLPLPAIDEHTIRPDGLSDGPDPIGGKGESLPDAGASEATGPVERPETTDDSETGSQADAMKLHAKR